MKNSLRIDRRSLMLGAGGLLAVAAGLGKVGLEGLDSDPFAEQKRRDEKEKMPVIFVGHGNPMNAIEDNAFTRSLGSLGQDLPVPKAILVVSAHWLSAGTWVTRMDQPKTIHDFRGFPQELFDVRYPAPGSPELAAHIQTLSTKRKIQGDDSWGLDHGTWAVLNKMYPKADIPVLQLSIDMSESGEFHLELGKVLSSLREQGVLILGSGNIVHNLRHAAWDKPLQGYDWAHEFDSWVKNRLAVGDYKSLANDFMKTQAGVLSVPTPDHYLPLLYVLGAADANRDELHYAYEGYDMGSISMRTFVLGKTAG